MSNLSDFGAAVLRGILDDSDFFGSEESDDICELLQRFGYATREAYDPEQHEIEDAEPGEIVWIFTQAMEDDATPEEPKP